MERIKRILILCHFEFFDKGEGRHKRIQVVSPLFFWKREKRSKDSTLLFSAEFSLSEKTRFEKTKLRKLFGKGRTRRDMCRKEFLEVLKNC